MLKETENKALSCNAPISDREFPHTVLLRSTIIGGFLFLGSQSFRFGPEIAYVASCLLDVLKGIRNKTLVGGVKEGESHCYDL